MEWESIFNGVLHIKMQHGRVTLFSFFCPYIWLFSCHLLKQNGWVRVSQLLSGIICVAQCCSSLKKKGAKHETNYMEKLILLSCFFLCSFLKQLFLSPLTWFIERVHKALQLSQHKMWTFILHNITACEAA